MKKLLAAILILVAGTESLTAFPLRLLSRLFQPQTRTVPSVVSGQRVVVCFDIHDVVCTKYWSGRLHYFWHEVPNKWEVIKILPDLYTFVKKERETCSVWEPIFQKAQERFPQLKNVDFIALANMQTINTDTLEYVKYLKAQGYIVILASNMGYKTYENFREKFPEVCALFDGAFVVHPNKKDGVYYGKKTDVYFENLKDHCFAQYATNKLALIDDKKRNCVRAIRLGISALRFKNIKQVQKELPAVLTNLLAQQQSLQPVI